MEATLSDQNYQQQLDRELVKQLNDAKYASLTSRAVSDQARALIDHFIEMVEGVEEESGWRKNKRSEKSRSAFRRAMEGFVGDLLRAYADNKSGGWVYRSQKANSFSGGDVSYRNFVTVVKRLRGLVETKAGYQEWSNGFDPGGPRLPIRTKATRFRATRELIRFCEDFNIDVSEIGDHFIPELPRHPLVKKAGSVRDPYGVKVRGQVMRFERTGKAKELEQQVRDLKQETPFPINRVIEKMALSNKVTLTAERQPEGKIRVTSNSWQDEKVLLPNEVLEVRCVSGRLHVARKERHPDEWDCPVEAYDPYGPGIDEEDLSEFVTGNGVTHVAE
jgi:hypothetical protein